MRCARKSTSRSVIGLEPLDLLRAAVFWSGLSGISGIACAQLSLSVRVTDRGIGSALERVRVGLVLFRNTIVYMDSTGSSGRVGFLNAKKLRYVLRTTKDGYQWTA